MPLFSWAWQKPGQVINWLAIVSLCLFCIRRGVYHFP